MPHEKHRNAPPAKKIKETPKRIIPHAIWEPMFFESINARAKLSKLPPLRSYVVPPGDIEVRVWAGFGKSYLQGIVLKQAGGKWSALHLLPAYPEYTRQDYKQLLPEPKPGWVPFWDRLIREGLLSLPDSSTLKGENLVLDGMAYVVEINRNKTYRTYAYTNPQAQKWPEAKQMLTIAQLLFVGFGIKR